jgi:hypothetical protein
MKRSYQRLLKGIRSDSSLIQLAEQGMSPAEFREYVITMFSPFVVNKDSLEEFAVPTLVPDAVVLSRLCSGAWSRKMLSRVLKDHRTAAISDEHACFTGYGEWELQVQRGLSDYWSAFQLEIEKKDELPLEEFTHEVARIVAVLIEASLKPMLKELLLIVRIREARSNPLKGLPGLKLGTLVGELVDTSGYPDLFAPPPWRLRLNQWRNICQHYSFEIEGNKIIAHYGTYPERRQVTLSRSGLFRAAAKCIQVFEIIKIGRTIAILENRRKIQPHLPLVSLRPEQEVLELACGLATVGFEVSDVLLEDRSVHAVVRDLTKQPPEERMLHASQFVYEVWRHLPRDSVSVEFRDWFGRAKLTTTARGVDCQAVAEERMPLSDLAHRVVFLRHD